MSTVCRRHAWNLSSVSWLSLPLLGDYTPSSICKALAPFLKAHNLNLPLGHVNWHVSECDTDLFLPPPFFALLERILLHCVGERFFLLVEFPHSLHAAVVFMTPSSSFGSPNLLLRVYRKYLSICNHMNISKASCNQLTASLWPSY